MGAARFGQAGLLGTAISAEQSVAKLEPGKPPLLEIPSQNKFLSNGSCEPGIVPRMGTSEDVALMLAAPFPSEQVT